MILRPRRRRADRDGARRCRDRTLVSRRSKSPPRVAPTRSPARCARRNRATTRSPPTAATPAAAPRPRVGDRRRSTRVAASASGVRGTTSGGGVFDDERCSRAMAANSGGARRRSEDGGGRRRRDPLDRRRTCGTAAHADHEVACHRHAPATRALRRHRRRRLRPDRHRATRARATCGTSRSCSRTPTRRRSVAAAAKGRRRSVSDLEGFDREGRDTPPRSSGALIPFDRRRSAFQLLLAENGRDKDWQNGCRNDMAEAPSPRTSRVDVRSRPGRSRRRKRGPASPFWVASIVLTRESRRLLGAFTTAAGPAAPRTTTRRRARQTWGTRRPRTSTAREPRRWPRRRRGEARHRGSRAARACE